MADEESLAAVLRITGGNFRLLNRLLTQIARVLEINRLDRVTVIWHWIWVRRGDAILPRLESGKIEVTELRRLPNVPVQLPVSLYWDSLRLFHEICRGIRAIPRHHPRRLSWSPGSSAL